jgi:SAM-dependent methyltransferase
MNQRHGNLQKHLNPNPVQRRLLDRFHHRIIDLVRSTGAKSILDAGCGEGFTLHDLRGAGLLAETRTAGIDFSAEALQWHQAEQMSGVPLSRADIHHLPFPDNSFDLVYSLEVLEHIPDSAVGLRELRRVSRDYVLVSVPHEPFFRGANFLRGKHLSDFGNDPEHLHNYSGRVFRRLFGAELDLLWHGYSFPWQIAFGRKARNGQAD